VRRVRGRRKDRQVLGRVVPLAAALSRRVGSKCRHSQVPVLRPHDRAHRERDAPHPPQRQGQRPACSTELASTCRPLPAPARSPAQSRMAWRGVASTEADPEARRSPACVLSAGPSHRLPFRRRMG
jgi:hypothetical protein